MIDLFGSLGCGLVVHSCYLPVGKTAPCLFCPLIDEVDDDGIDVLLGLGALSTPKNVSVHPVGALFHKVLQPQFG